MAKLLGPVKILIIGNSVARLKSSAEFLAKRGFSCDIVSSLRNALEAAQNNKPEIVLISWNIKTPLPSKIAEVFQGLGALCVGFAEESDPKTAAALASSTLKTIIHAPVSGPVLAVRIQRLISEQEENRAAFADIPDPRLKKAPQDQTWVPEQTKDLRSRESLQHHLKEITQKIVKRESDTPSGVETKCETIGIIEVISENLKGYLVVANCSNEKLSGLVLQRLREQLRDALLLFGRGLRTDQSLQIQLPVGDFESWGRSQGVFNFKGFFERERLSIFFLERLRHPIDMEFKDNASMGEIPIDAIAVGHEVPFDVYINLPANKKHLRYFKKGNAADETRLQHLKNRGVSFVLIEKTEKPALKKYEATSTIRESLKLHRSLGQEKA